MSELRSKTPEELGISDDEYINLAESLLLAMDLISFLHPGPLYELNRMKVEYLEGLFGLKQEASLPDDLK